MKERTRTEKQKHKNDKNKSKYTNIKASSANKGKFDRNYTRIKFRNDRHEILSE